MHFRSSRSSRVHFRRATFRVSPLGPAAGLRKVRHWRCAHTQTHIYAWSCRDCTFRIVREVPWLRAKLTPTYVARELYDEYARTRQRETFVPALTLEIMAYTTAKLRLEVFPNQGSYLHLMLMRNLSSYLAIIFKACNFMKVKSMFSFLLQCQTAYRACKIYFFTFIV